MAKGFLFVLLFLLELKLPGVQLLLLLIPEERLELYADLLAALRELEDLERQEERGKTLGDRELKEYVLLRLDFEILACRSQIRRQQKLKRQGESAIEPFSQELLDEDLQDLHDLRAAREDVLTMDPQLVREIYLARTRRELPGAEARVRFLWNEYFGPDASDDQSAAEHEAPAWDYAAR